MGPLLEARTNRASQSSQTTPARQSTPAVVTDLQENPDALVVLVASALIPGRILLWRRPCSYLKAPRNLLIHNEGKTECGLLHRFAKQPPRSSDVREAVESVLSHP
jgi:hypothetical protein